MSRANEESLFITQHNQLMNGIVQVQYAFTESKNTESSFSFQHIQHKS